MENKKISSHLSESLRRKLENFPEEFPTENDWQEVRSKMMSEGLLREKSYRKRYLLLLLLLLILSISGLVIVPLWSKKQNHVETNVSQQTETNATEINNVIQSKPSAKDESYKNKNIKFNHEEKTAPSAITQKPVKTERPSQSRAKSDTHQKNNVHRSGKNLSKRASVFPSSIETAKQDEQIRNESSAPAEVKSEPVSEAKEETTSEVTKATDVSSKTEIAKGTEVNNQPETAATSIDSSEAKNTSEATTPLASTDSVSAVLSNSPKTDSAQTATASENKTEKENTSRRKVQLGLFVSWDSNKYYLKESSNAESHEVNYIMGSDSINGEKSAGQFTVGLRGSYSISDKLAIEAGIFYSQKRKVDAVIYTQQYSSSTGNSISDFTYHFNAKYFEIEQRIKYFILQTKPSIYIAAGAKESFNMNQSNPDYFEHIIYSESAVPHTERVLLKPASIGLSLVLAAGMEISLNARCNFFFEPSYTYALDPVINNPDYIIVPVNLYRRSFSFGTGMNYKF